MSEAKEKIRQALEELHPFAREGQEYIVHQATEAKRFMRQGWEILHPSGAIDKELHLEQPKTTLQELKAEIKELEEAIESGQDS